MSNKLDYTQYDWQSLLNQITNILKTYNSWSDAYVSSTGTALLELYSYIANMILYHIERTAEECYIQTAQRYSSLVNLTSLLNYIPRRNISASSNTGNVVFTLSAPNTYDIIIPQYTSLSTLGGYKYLTQQSLTIPKGSTTGTIGVIQGSLVTQTYTSAGGINQEYQITDTNVENTNLFCSVSVAGTSTLWTKVSTFLKSIGTDTVFVLVQNLDGTLTLKFGDNVNGQSPNSGNIITISYVKSDGLAGCVYSAGNLTKINDTIVDIQGNTISTISVNNTQSILGGLDAETIEEIRYNAPRVFSTATRFVTKQDGINLLTDYGLGSVNVWGENEVTNPTVADFNVAYISGLLPPDPTNPILGPWTLMSPDYKTTLTNYLYTVAPLTIRYTYVDPTIVYVYPTVSLYVKKGYSLSTVQSAVLAVLQGEFYLGKTVFIGTNLRYANVISAIQAVDGVSYCYLNLQVYQPLTHGAGYNYSGMLPLLTAQAGTVSLYTGSGVLLGTDNGTTFTSVNSNYTVSGAGAINHTTGAISVNINPLPSGTVYVLYNQNSNGDLVVNKQQILKYYSSSLTTQSI